MKMTIPILENASIQITEEENTFEGELRKRREELEAIVQKMPLPLQEEKLEGEDVPLRLTTELFHILYLSFSLLDKLEKVQPGIIKMGNIKLLLELYRGRVKVKKVVKVGID